MLVLGIAMMGEFLSGECAECLPSQVLLAR
jgi:hypothetical protein